MRQESPPKNEPENGLKMNKKQFNDKDVSFHELKELVKVFCEERDWDPFHGPKDLAIGAVTEASELLEHFRFLDSKQCDEKLHSAQGREAISQELADVLFFLLRFAQRYEFDLVDSFVKKMQINGKKYPADEFRGRNHKSQY